jgi:hypothetical protein
MRNSCDNILLIEGPDAEKVMTLFSRLRNKFMKSHEEVTYKYFKDSKGIFHIYLDKSDNFISFNSKAGPALNTVMYVFNNYNIKGSFTYIDKSIGAYGKIVKFKTGIKAAELTTLDKQYIRVGEYDVFEEVVEHMLDKKIKRLKIKKGLAV